MKATEMIIEFVVIGSISAAFLLLPLLLLCRPMLTFPDLKISGAAVAAIVIPFILYFVGTLIHFMTWWWWRRAFHRRWFTQWLESRSGVLYFPMAEEAFRYHASNESRVRMEEASAPRKAGFMMDWCRFYVFQYGATELQIQYLRQFHLYRLSYGPLTAVVAALALAVWLSVVRLIDTGPDDSMLLMPVFLLILLASISGARHRATRMWKYLCYSSAVLSEGSVGTAPTTQARDG